MELSAVEPHDREAVARFLVSTFGTRSDAPFADPRLLDWKFFAPRPDWTDPRSYILRDQGRIVAHTCIWPVSFALPDAVVGSMHLIDWAASSDVPGAGTLLYREMMKRSSTVLAVGGAQRARKILRKLGFAEVGQLDVYARVVRPWSQFRSRPSRRNWKNVPWLVRNSLWKCTAPSQKNAAWKAMPVSDFPDSLDPLLATRASHRFTLNTRTVAMLNYALRCPTANCRAFLLLFQGELHGYFLLSRLGGQSRIADLWISSESQQDWTAAYATAFSNAADDPAACEVVAVASHEQPGEAIRQNGFHRRTSKPVVLYDPGRLLLHAPPLNLSLLESDAFFLYDPENPYLT